MKLDYYSHYFSQMMLKCLGALGRTLSQGLYQGTDKPCPCSIVQIDGEFTQGFLTHGLDACLANCLYRPLVIKRS